LAQPPPPRTDRPQRSNAAAENACDPAGQWVALDVAAFVIALLGYLYLVGALLDWVRLAAARLPIETISATRGVPVVIGDGLRATVLAAIVFVLVCAAAYVASARRWGEHKRDWQKLIREPAHPPTGGPGYVERPDDAVPRNEVPIRILAGFHVVVLAALVALIPARAFQEIISEDWWLVAIIWTVVFVVAWYGLTAVSIAALHERTHGFVWLVIACVSIVLLAAPLGVLVLAGILTCTLGRVVARWERPTTLRGLVRSPLPWVLAAILLLADIAYAAVPPVSFSGATVTTTSGQQLSGGYLGRVGSGVLLATCKSRVNATSIDERVRLLPSTKVREVAVGGPNALFDSGKRPSLAMLALRAVGVNAEVPTLGSDLHPRGAPCAGSQRSESASGDPALGAGVLVGPEPEGGQAHDGEPPIGSTSPARVAAIARRFQPTLEVTVADRFWPVSVPAVLHEKGPGGGGVCLIQQRAPQRDCEPTPSSLAANGSSSSDYLQLPVALTLDPSPNSQFEAFERGQQIQPGTPEQWLADPGVLKPWSTAEIYFFARVLEPRLFPKGAQDPSVHGSFIALEYWFYYPYNYYPLAVRSPLFQDSPLAGDLYDVDHHQGDWEHIDILLNPKTDAPEWLYMARHADEGQWLAWSSPKIARDGEHPIIQGAYGGHPSYEPGCGQRRRAKTLGSLSDWLVCGSGRFAFRAATTPLVDIARRPWGCWRGYFGEAATGAEVENAARPESVRDRLRNLPLAAGPQAPLRQAENQGVCARGAIATEEAALRQPNEVPAGHAG
jgi:hypothetical protein